MRQQESCEEATSFPLKVEITLGLLNVGWPLIPCVWKIQRNRAGEGNWHERAIKSCSSKTWGPSFSAKDFSFWMTLQLELVKGWLLN
jgi:hypothetical protein